MTDKNITQFSEKELQRFWSKVAITANDEKCWEWQMSLNKGGYGKFLFRYQKRLAHRIAYSISFGFDFANNKLCVLHKCDNRKCVNPNHLFLGTYNDNIQDMMRKGRNKQPRGENHPTRKNPSVVARGEKAGLAKFTNAQILEIRERRAKGAKFRHLGREFGVRHTTIMNIVNRKTWKHI